MGYHDNRQQIPCGNMQPKVGGNSSENKYTWVVQKGAIFD